MIEELEQIARRDFSLPPVKRLSFLIHSGIEILTVFVSQTACGPPAGILKISREGIHPGLEREFVILKHLEGHAPAAFLDSVPRAKSWQTVHRLGVLSLAFVTGERRKMRGSLSQMLPDFFSKMSEWVIELGRIPVPPSEEKAGRFDHARTLILRLASRHPHGKDMRETLTRVEQYDHPSLQQRIRPVVTHRDLAPNNVLFYKGRLRVVDWDNSKFGYPLTDWVRFACNCLSLSRSPGKMAEGLKELLYGRNRLSDAFYRETQRIAEALPLEKDLVAPLFLLGLFDFLEGYHYQRTDAWENEFDFLLAGPEWLERLMQ